MGLLIRQEERGVISTADLGRALAAGRTARARAVLESSRERS